MATILVINGHEGVRRALQQWLEVEFPFHQVGAFNTVEDVLNHTFYQPPDLVIMDVGYLQHKGINAVRQLKANMPEVPIVVLTMLVDDGHRAEALRAGAEAYIGTGKMHEELIPQLTMLLSRVQV